MVKETGKTPPPVPEAAKRQHEKYLGALPDATDHAEVHLSINQLAEMGDLFEIAEELGVKFSNATVDQIIHLVHQGESGSFKDTSPVKQKLIEELTQTARNLQNETKMNLRTILSKGKEEYAERKKVKEGIAQVKEQIESIQLDENDLEEAA